MKRAARLVISFAVALVAAPFLPLYLERTMLRSWRVDRLGDQIDWGWKLTSLTDYWSNYHYMAREQQPAVWLTLDIALAVLYALIFAVVIDLALAWRKRQASKTTRISN
jgi:hypothetical protein